MGISIAKLSILFLFIFTLSQSATAQLQQGGGGGKGNKEFEDTDKLIKKYERGIEKQITKIFKKLRRNLHACLPSLDKKIHNLSELFEEIQLIKIAKQDLHSVTLNRQIQCAGDVINQSTIINYSLDQCLFDEDIIDLSLLIVNDEKNSIAILMREFDFKAEDAKNLYEYIKFNTQVSDHE